MSTPPTVQQRSAAMTTISDPYQLQTQQYRKQRQFEFLQQRWQAEKIQQQRLQQQLHQNQYPSSLQQQQQYHQQQQQQQQQLQQPPLQQQRQQLEQQQQQLMRQHPQQQHADNSTPNAHVLQQQLSNVSHSSPTPIGLHDTRQPTLMKSFQSGHSTGQAVLRLIQLGDFLTPGKKASYRSFWDEFVQDFFAQDSKLVFGVWNTVTKEQEQFEICQPLVARFFHTQYECQVTSIKLTMDQTMEYILPQGMLVECPISSFIYRYDNDTMVVLTGRTSIILRMDITQGNLKIQQWDFICHHVEEFISRYGIVDAAPPTPPVTTTKKKGKQQQQPKVIGKQVPGSVVNECGLPGRVYSLLKMSDAMSKHGENALTNLFISEPQHYQNGVKEAMSPSPMDGPRPSATPKLTDAEVKVESPSTTKRDAKKPKQAKKKRTATPTRKNSKSTTTTSAAAPTTSQPSLNMPPPSSPVMMNNVNHPHFEALTPQQRHALILQQQQQQQQQHMFQIQQHHMQMQQHQVTPSSPYPQGTTYPSTNHISPNTVTSNMISTQILESNGQASYLSTPPTPNQRKRKTMAQEDKK